MTQFKTLLITAVAGLALPSAAFAQVPADAAKGSDTTYEMTETEKTKAKAKAETEKAKAAAKAKMLEEAKARSIEKAKTYGETYGMSDDEKAKRLITSGQPYVIQKSGTPKTMSTPAATTPNAPAPLNCPSGTKDAGDGTCMIIGDWKP